MGSYTFRWEHPAEDVHVTGTFDNWGKTVELEKKGSLFEKTVELPLSQEKILYKFVVDGKWIHDHTAQTETDHEGNVNNVLYPHDIKPTSSLATAAISSVAPGATTTALAGQQPLEKDRELPGAFPETPAAATENQTFSVNPLPATGGIGNPIHLAPGEPVPDPSTITGNTLTSNVKLDEASYDKPDASAPFLPPVLSPGSEAEAKGEKPIFDSGLGPVKGTMIPESSMAMGTDAPGPIDDVTGPTISSVAPQSTTAQLAGQQPLEHNTKAPEVVEQSQQQAHVEPEASANPTAVSQKEAVEQELESKVPEAPAAAESNGGILGVAAAGVAAAGATAAGAALLARNKVTETTGRDPASVLPQSVRDSINNMNQKGSVGPPQTVQDSINNLNQKGSVGPSTTTEAVAGDATLPQQTAAGEAVKVPAQESEDHARETTQTVPGEVVKSQKEAHWSPEATANREAVVEKSAVEQELLKKVPESEAAGEPAPQVASTSALSATAPVAAATAATAAAAAAAGGASSAEAPSASGAPQLADPTAGVAALSLDDAKPSTTTGAGEAALTAPATEPAVPPTQKAAAENLTTPPAATPAVAERSRDVSPMTVPAGSSGTPQVTTGVGESQTPAQSSANKPVGTPRTTDTTKPTTPNAKRHSFLGRAKGTPDSQKSVASEASTGSGQGEKKKGFFKRLADRLK